VSGAGARARLGAASWVALLGTLGAMAGPLNGDFPAYLAQARAGELGVRATHVAFVAALTPVAWLPSAAFGYAAAAALAAGAWAHDRDPLRRALWLLVVTPIAPYAEVDPLWVALLLGTRGSAVGVAAAVAVSPAALLALGAARTWAAWAAAAATVLALTLATGGDWWWGDRGVLTAPAWLPGRVLAGWAVGLPWLLLPVVRWDRALALDLVATTPLLLLPPDVPGWLVPAIRLGRAVDPSAPGLVRQLALQGLVVVAWTGSAAARIAAENDTISAVAAALGPEDGVEAPFSWGSRLGVAAAGAPYGVRWHPPGRFLGAQRDAWCAAPPPRVWVLPPDPGGAIRVRGDAARDCR
jgi:hypothetical protein